MSHSQVVTQPEHDQAIRKDERKKCAEKLRELARTKRPAGPITKHLRMAADVVEGLDLAEFRFKNASTK